MRNSWPSHPQRTPWRFPFWLGVCFFAAVALFFLWEEHRAHLFGVLPYLLFLLCPLMHVLMHRGHGSHEKHDGHRDGALVEHEKEGAA